MDEYGEEAVEEKVEEIFKHESIESVETPEEEWSGALFDRDEPNAKKLQYEEGLYLPGSGEICAKYIPMSASSVFRHVYYKYPALVDPGIDAALLAPLPTKIYSDDGQELYLDLCKEISAAPIRSFYNSLMTDKVDLSYYGIDTKGFRALFLALKLNKYVMSLDLTDNWMDRDASYHLGEMIVENTAIKDLKLKGCRLGPSGAEAFCNFLSYNRVLVKLDLSRNQLTDDGIVYLADAIERGISVLDLNLSYNNLTAEGLNILVEAFETRNTLTHLDLSWNSIFSPPTVQKLCQTLVANKKFEKLDLSWNGLASSRIGHAIRTLLRQVKSLKELIVTNNKLDDDGIKPLIKSIKRAKQLKVLDLSDNPISPVGALALLKMLESRAVKLQNLFLNNVIVDEEFMKTLEQISMLNFRQTTVVTHGYVRPTMRPVPVDIRIILMKRAAYLTASSKKAKCRDFGQILLQMRKESREPRICEMFARDLSSIGVNMPQELQEQFCLVFAGPRAKDKNKSRTVSIDAMIDFVTRLWPDTKLPPTPPPEPEPEVPPTPAKKKKK